MGHESESPRRTRRSIVVGVLALAIQLTSCGSQSFNSEKWKAGDRAIRGTMELDLRRNKTLEGKPREYVLTLLGPPDIRCDDGEYFVYLVEKPRPLGGPWVEYFGVGFDRAGVVTSTWIDD